MGTDVYGINGDVLQRIVVEIKSVRETGVQVAIVVGGGNIFRGIAAAAQGMDRPTADYMGMLATVMNALALRDGLMRHGVTASVMSALPVAQVVDGYARERAISDLDDGRIVIFAAGTGNPFFTTDTAATLRALEVGADIVFKATKVDGVYDKDPLRHDDAHRYDVLTYDEVLENRLGVMDATAIALCRDNNLPLRVFNINKSESMMRAVLGKDEGTLVHSGE